MGSVVQEISILVLDTDQSIGKGVERFLSLCLSGLDHDGFSYYEREVNGWCMIAEIKQPFGDIHGADLALAAQVARTSDKFVHAAVTVWNLEFGFEAREQVVGVEHGIFTDLAQATRAQRTNIAIAAHQNA